MAVKSSKTASKEAQDEFNGGNPNNPKNSQDTKKENRGGSVFHNTAISYQPINNNIGQRDYNKLKDELVEIFTKTSDEDMEIAVIDLDNSNNPSLVFSSLIIAMRYKSGAIPGVAYHTLLIQSTGGNIAPITDVIDGRNVEIMRLPSDAVDDELIKIADSKVRKYFTDGPYYNVDSQVVPISFLIDDKEAIHELALNVGLACSTELSVRNEGYEDLNLSKIGNESNLNVNLAFNKQQIKDIDGSTFRSDVLVGFESVKSGAGNNKYASVNQGQNQSEISVLNAFVDLVPIVQQNNIYAAQQPNSGMNHKYAARLVITSVKSSFSYTPGSILLAIATSIAVRDNNNWIQSFKPRMIANGGIDTCDIGALNIEANLENNASGFGQIIDTKSDDFKLEDLGKYVSSIIREGLCVSLDCPDASSQSWYLSVFSKAYDGSRSAYDVIIRAADELTNGNFSKYFAAGDEIFTDKNNRIHNGYWVDKNAGLRDLREIDHLAVCNLLGQTNPQAITQWSNTFFQKQRPLVSRLDERRRIISTLTDETAVFTGFSNRVTFTAKFLDALTAGINDTGVNVRINTPMSSTDFNNQRGIADFVGSAIIGTSSFRQPNAYSVHQQGNGGQFTRRW